MMQVNAETSAVHFDVGLISRPAALTHRYHWIAGRGAFSAIWLAARTEIAQSKLTH
jgi:hypothetical protein